MLVSFECTVVGQRLKNLQDVRKLQAPKEPLNVYRSGKWGKLPGDALLPGDIVSVVRSGAGGGGGKGYVSVGAGVVLDGWARVCSRHCVEKCDMIACMSECSVLSTRRMCAEGGEDLVVQADLLLLAGTCIVDEAVLTGG